MHCCICDFKPPWPKSLYTKSYKIIIQTNKQKYFYLASEKILLLHKRAPVVMLQFAVNIKFKSQLIFVVKQANSYATFASKSHM